MDFVVYRVDGIGKWHPFRINGFIEINGLNSGFFGIEFAPIPKGVLLKSSSTFRDFITSRMMTTVPDHLIQRCLKGERKAQRELYDLTLPYLRAIVQRQLYKSQEWNDVLQEIYLRIFRSLSQFDSAKGTFLNWSSRIAINTAITYGVKATSNETTTLDVEQHELAVKPLAINDLMVEQLLHEMSKMPKTFTAFSCW